MRRRVDAALPPLDFHAMRAARSPRGKHAGNTHALLVESKMELNDAEMSTMKWQKYPQKTLSYTCKFDFEVGYLVRSPCRTCAEIGRLPACSRSCTQLERVQTLLADSISCTRRR